MGLDPTLFWSNLGPTLKTRPGEPNPVKGKNSCLKTGMQTKFKPKGPKNWCQPSHILFGN